MAIVLGGSCPRWQFSGWQLSWATIVLGGNCPGGGCPGGCSPDTVSNRRVACGPRGRFVQSAMLFGNFQIFNISII